VLLLVLLPLWLFADPIGVLRFILPFVPLPVTVLFHPTLMSVQLVVLFYSVQLLSLSLFGKNFISFVRFEERMQVCLFLLSAVHLTL